jgi:chromosome segregation ATPase
MATMQLREKDEHLLALRSQLDSSERASYEFSKKCDARETELNQVRQQNDEMQKRIVTQEAQLQSLENELRIAHSDDALTKVKLTLFSYLNSLFQAKYNHERIVDEMRRQHKELVDDLSEEIRALKNKLAEEEAACKEAQAHSEEVEKNRKRDMIENGETINRLNTLVSFPLQKNIRYSGFSYFSTPKISLKIVVQRS